MKTIFKVVVGVCAVICTVQAQAQTPQTVCQAELAVRDASLNERCALVQVSVKTNYGVERTDSMLLTHYKPEGVGPFPLVVMNHGRGPERQTPERVRSTSIARYWVQRGFAVFVPTRLGYGATALSPDPEDSGPCNAKDYQPMMEAATEQVRSAINFGKALPWVDASRVIVMGQSVGGFTSVAASGKRFPGVVAAINFAGGAGGDPIGRPERPCQEFKIGQTMALYGKTANAPMLWLYAPNDKYWGEKNPKDWFAAYQAAGGKAEFVALPQVGAATDDGHGAIGRTTGFWYPLVDAFIRQLGFSIPQLSVLTEAVIPAGLSPVQQDTYRKFAASALPRALAFSQNGATGYAFGETNNGQAINAADRALGFCNARGAGACKIVAIDHQWMGLAP